MSKSLKLDAHIAFQCMVKSVNEFSDFYKESGDSLELHKKPKLNRYMLNALVNSIRENLDVVQRYVDDISNYIEDEDHQTIYDAPRMFVPQNQEYKPQRVEIEWRGRNFGYSIGPGMPLNYDIPGTTNGVKNVVQNGDWIFLFLDNGERKNILKRELVEKAIAVSKINGSGEVRWEDSWHFYKISHFSQKRDDFLRDNSTSEAYKEANFKPFKDTPDVPNTDLRDLPDDDYRRYKYIYEKPKEIGNITLEFADRPE